MRFGCMLFTRDLHAVAEVSRLAEERGFELIGVADSPALTYDPYMALTLAAHSTTRARVGTAVTNAHSEGKAWFSPRLAVCDNLPREYAQD